MKSIVFLFGFVAFVSAVEQARHKLSPQNIQNLKKASDECAAEVNVDPGLFSKLADGTLAPGDSTNNYIFCTVLKLKFIRDDGHVNMDRVVSPVQDHPLVEEFKETIKKCDEVTKESPVATLVQIYRCYLEKAPVLYQF